MKILIIEDETSLLELMKNSLEKERYVVETATNYSNAWQKLSLYDYKCILPDIMLPDGKGLNLLQDLKKIHKERNVI